MFVAVLANLYGILPEIFGSLTKLVDKVDLVHMGDGDDADALIGFNDQMSFQRAEQSRFRKTLRFVGGPLVPLKLVAPPRPPRANARCDARMLPDRYMYYMNVNGFLCTNYS